MRIKSNFVLQSVADEFIVVPIAEEASKMHGIIKLNKSGAYIWNMMLDGKQSAEDIENALITEYYIDRSKAHIDLETFLKQIHELGCIED